MNRILPLLALLACGACGIRYGGAPPLHHPDLTITEVALSSDDSPEVFTSYSNSGPVRWNQGWPWKFDLTGIGWDRAQTVTAITPRHVVMANHFRRKAGSPAVFHDRNGRPHRRVIQKILSTGDFGYHSDVAIGLLDLPLPKSIRTYPLLRITEADFPTISGALALVTDQKRRIYFHRVRDISPRGISFRFDPELADSKHKRLIIGDSGNPSFLLSHGELVLIETHTYGGSGSGPFYGAPTLIEIIRKVVADLDSGFQLRTVGLDERIRQDAKEGRQAMPVPPAKPPQTVAPRQTPSASSTRKPRPRVVQPASP